MNKIKIINLPEITEADNTTYIPVSSGSTNATRKISAANLVGSNSTIDHTLQFGAGATIKIQTGVDGSTPVYREFPATELSSSDLNGTSYVMVYGVGTPAENAAELQAAYNEAKNMPRYLGELPDQDPGLLNVGQTYFDTVESHYYVVINTGILRRAITEAEAKSVRTTLIVAPGDYTFGVTKFAVNTEYIDVVSITGNKDVKLDGINITADNVYIKGVNCGVVAFIVATNLPNSIFENCEGDALSFGAGFTFSSKSINCIGGASSFGGDGGIFSGIAIDCIGGNLSFGGGDSGTFSGTSINCTGGVESFGGGVDASLIGTLENCKLTSGTFQTPTGAGKIYNCINSSGHLINNPLPVFSDNAAAASLPIGALYRTATGVQMIKY